MQSNKATGFAGQMIEKNYRRSIKSNRLSIMKWYFNRYHDPGIRYTRFSKGLLASISTIFITRMQNLSKSSALETFSPFLSHRRLDATFSLLAIRAHVRRVISRDKPGGPIEARAIFSLDFSLSLFLSLTHRYRLS